MFSGLDWATVAIYLVATAAAGLWAARGQRSERDYFLGNRELSWWTVGLSIVATETSALTFIGVPAMAFGALVVDEGGGYLTRGGDLRFIQIVAGYVIARIIVAALMVPHYFRGDVYTPYQLLALKYGEPPRLLAAVFALLNMCLQAGVRVYVTAIPVMIVIRTVVPDWGIWRSIVLFSVVAIAYTAVGGVRAVVVTDVVQFFVFVFGGLFALLYLPTLVEPTASGAVGWAAIIELGGDKLSWLDWGLVGRAPGQGLAEWAGACASRLFGGGFNIWMGLIGATFGVMVSHGADQLNVQRVLACRDARHGRRALWLSAAVIAPLFLVFLLVGVGLFAFYSQRGFDFGGIAPWDPRAAKPTPKADYVFPIFIVTQLPSPVRGLLVAGILAAAMSSLTSALTAISSVAMIDLLRPLRRARAAQPETEPKGLAAGRLGTLVAGLALIAVAWWAQGAPLIFNFVFTYAGVFSGAKLGALLLAVRRGEGPALPVVAGMLASALVMGGVVAASKAGLLQITWPWYAALGTAICYGVAALLWPRRPAAARPA